MISKQETCKNAERFLWRVCDRKCVMGLGEGKFNLPAMKASKICVHGQSKA